MKIYMDWCNSFLMTLESVAYVTQELTDFLILPKALVLTDRLDDLGFESWHMQEMSLFSKMSRLVLGPTHIYSVVTQKSSPWDIAGGAGS